MFATTTQPRLATRFAYGKKRELSTGYALSHDQIRAAVPSVFAEQAHESRSSRYTYIPTSYVLEGLQKEGFRVFSATQAITRDQDRMGHAKHMLRLRHETTFESGYGQEVNELILINSHDGASAYQLMAGCFRFVCSNGMIVGNSYGEVRVRHSGNVRDEVVQGAYQLLDSFEEVTESREAMKGLMLTDGEQRAFARAALAARFPDKDVDTIDIRPEQVIATRRYADEGRDLWSTFNRAQENLVQGGIRNNNPRRRTRTRAVQGIDQNVTLNRALWTLAEEMEKLKAQAAA